MPDAYLLQIIIFWICVAIGTIVFGTLIYSLIKHRKSKNASIPFHKHFSAEIIWTVIPFIILIALATPAAKTLMRMQDVNTSVSFNKQASI